MEVKAHLNYLRIAPRKVRLVAGVIKGMDVQRAELELSHTRKRSSEPLLKLLKSAMANATHNFQLSESGLYIKDIVVNQGTVLKRSTPRAFGRASPIHKRTSHISLVLDTREAAAAKRKKRTKHEEPTVRDVTSEDIKDFGIPAEEKGEREENFHKMKAKPTNFVRRVFKRKVI